MGLLLADENLPVPTVVALRQYGHDVLTMLDLGKAGLAIPDDEVLALAASLNRCVVTQNRKDFIKLHNQQPNHAGILICTVDPDFTALANRITHCLEAAESIARQLLRVQRPPQ